MFNQEQVSQSKVSIQPLLGTICLYYDYKVVHEDFKFHDNKSNRSYLSQELKESLFIKRDKPSLN